MSKNKIVKSQLHLLGVTALVLSTKYEEIYPPDIRDLMVVSENKFTKEQLLEMEKEILRELDYNITAPSSYRFLQRFSHLSPIFSDEEVFFFAQYV